ncbi:hypothetical protein [Staphylococcus aureus]|nr:hypothetical protein [Staphylococcus aureus]
MIKEGVCEVEMKLDSGGSDEIGVDLGEIGEGVIGDGLYGD